MFKRLIVLGAAVGSGFLAASFLPQASERIRTTVGMPLGSAVRTQKPQANETGANGEQGMIRLQRAQIEKAGIQVAPVTGGRLSQHLHVPGTIVADANNAARIAVRTPGTVVELRKKLGDQVAKGEVVALLDSREIADAKSEYLAARVAASLQQTIFERDQSLWDRRVSSEQQFLRSQATYRDLKVKVDAARRKLTFLGLSATDIDDLPNQSGAQTERQEIRSPIAGRIVERRVDLGAAVGLDNLETELYGVLDLSRVWVDLAVSSGDLPLVQEGQTVTVRAEAAGEEAEGQIIFISPVLDQNTRAARVFAEISNPNERWRPGTFVSAKIKVSNHEVGVLIPLQALQIIDGKPTAFLKTDEGFAARPVETARTDDRMVEIIAGLGPGDQIAVANSFILKAELGKATAED